MARKYTRDNRGRFASGGGGATARGGRLRTAAGNKRATQTMKAAGAGGAGVMKGRAARTVAGERAMSKLAKRPEAAPPKASGRTRAQAAAAQAKRREGVAQRVQQRENSENQSYAGYNGRRQQQGLKTVSMERIKKGKSTGDTQLGLMGGGSAIKSPARFAGATVRKWSSGARIKGAAKPAAKPAQAKAAPKAVLPKSLSKPGVDKGAAFMRFMDRAQAIPGKRKAQSASDYNLTRRSRKTAKSMATAKKAEAYVFGLRGALLGR